MIRTSFSRLVLQAGCDVNIKDKDGWSPLHAAVHWEQQQAAEILTEAGADFSIRNNIVRLFIMDSIIIFFNSQTTILVMITMAQSSCYFVCYHWHQYPFT